MFDTSFHELPTELMLQIFTLFSEPILITPVTRHVPALHLAHVSRGWRNVAMVCPNLWDTISIEFPPSSGHNSSVRERSGFTAAYVDTPPELSPGEVKILQTLEFILPLSGPLRLTLKFAPMNKTNLVLVQALTKRSTEWQSITLEIPHDHDLYLLDPVKEPGALPILETVDIYLKHGHRDYKGVDHFRRAPRLQNLVLHKWKLDEFKLPYDQLLSIAFRRITYYPAAIEILLQCSKVADLTIGMSISAGKHPIYIQTEFESDTVRSFATAMTIWADASTEIFNSVTFPSLEKLTLYEETPTDVEEANHMGRDMPLKGIENFIQRSGCVITHLVLRDLHFRNVYTLLELLPSLTDLEIDEKLTREPLRDIREERKAHTVMRTPLVMGLHASRGQRTANGFPVFPLLPDLRRLVISTRGIELNDYDFATMIQSRVCEPSIDDDDTSSSSSEAGDNGQTRVPYKPKLEQVILHLWGRKFDDRTAREAWEVLEDISGIVDVQIITQELEPW